MTFSSAPFLVLFLPLCMLVYFSPLCGTRARRNAWLLTVSLGFFFWGEPAFIFVVLAGIALNWMMGRCMARDTRRKRLYLWVALGFDLGLLIVFKYLTFFLKNLGLLFPVPYLEIALPIGISFYTFQIMSYILDVYHGKVPCQESLAKLTLYVMMFPQLIAGPIVRYKTINREIDERRENAADFVAGLHRFALGLGKKVLLADFLSLIAEYVFGAAAGGISMTAAWIGALAYSLEIYYDFSGYSDMAIGLGLCFGFRFEENFNYPYIARSVTEFWRRWHISLTSWFRDYVYIPLGGNRVSPRRHIFNLFAVWALTGMWHGANWTFLVWGLVYWAVQALEKYCPFYKKLPVVVQHAYTLVIVMANWVVFRSETLADAARYLGMMFTVRGGFFDEQTLTLLQSSAVLLAAGCLGCVPFRARVQRLRPVWMLAVFALSLFCVLDGAYSPFIYFNF